MRIREGDTLVFETDERSVHLRLRQPEDVFAEYRARVEVDWGLDEETWRTAVQVFRSYAERRRARRVDSGSRRILADFVIGAHATRYASALLTLDGRAYRAAFPDLKFCSRNKVVARIESRIPENRKMVNFFYGYGSSKARQERAVERTP